jgi:hypothetical protein
MAICFSRNASNGTVFTSFSGVLCVDPISVAACINTTASSFT